MDDYSHYILAWKLSASMTANDVIETLNNQTPDDVYFSKKRERLSMRNMIKRETLKMRRVYNLGKGDLKYSCNS